MNILINPQKNHSCDVKFLKTRSDDNEKTIKIDLKHIQKKLYLY